MATQTIIDLRKTDLRTSVLTTPYWITSGSFGASADDLSAVLFSFPAARTGNYLGPIVFLEKFVVEITTKWAGGTITLDIGSCTLATDIITTGGVSTDVDEDEYIDNTDITHGTVGFYGETSGNASDHYTAMEASSFAAPYAITAADTTVPAIAAYVTSDAAITGGAARVHVLISSVP